jgi:hypothetical protein
VKKGFAGKRPILGKGTLPGRGQGGDEECLISRTGIPLLVEDKGVI